MSQHEIVIIAASLVILMLSVAIHEAAHGWVALKCGDTTARDLGRITFNPIPHIDPFMTILLPLVLLMSSNGAWLFGGAKPVPVLFHNLRRPWRDMTLVALAGPASNFLLALLFLILQRIAIEGFDMQPAWRGGAGQVLPTVLKRAVELNLLLTAFNLLPIPPLDGSRLMAWLLPEPARSTFVRLERFGMIIVIGLMILGVLEHLIVPLMDGLLVIAWEIVTLGGLV